MCGFIPFSMVFGNFPRGPDILQQEPEEKGANRGFFRQSAIFHGLCAGVERQSFNPVIRGSTTRKDVKLY